MKRFSFLLLVAVSFTCVAAAQELTVESMYHSEEGLTGRAPSTIQWSPDGKKVSYILHQESSEKADLYYIDVATGKPAVLVASERISSFTPPPQKGGKDDRERDNRARYHVAGYHWSPDSQHLLFDANGQLWYYTLATGTAVAMTDANEPASDPKFSPDGKMLSFVRSHNLYITEIQGKHRRQLTHDGSEDLLNGEVDWVYSEELDVRSNYFWSPNGKEIAFLQMNQARVPIYPIVDFIPQHPTVYNQKYPKVGDPNPEVRLAVMSSTGTKAGNKLRWIHLTNDKDIYIPRFGWVRDGLMWAQLLNRAQNQLMLFFIDTRTGKVQRVLDEKSDTWIEMNDDFQVLKSGDRFLWTSWRDGHTHVYLYSFDKSAPLSGPAKLVNQITKGDFETHGVAAVDETTGTLYVDANLDDDREGHLCSVKLDGSNFRNLTKSQPGTHEANFSPDTKTYVDHFSALMTPPQLSLCHVGGTCQVFWKSKSIDAYKLTPPQWVDFKAEDGTVLHGRIWLPPDSGHKVPLINNPYGGPHGQVVRNAWDGTAMFFNEILMRDGFAVLQVDNRGMGARGKKFAAALMHNLGEVELKDQLASIDQALQRFPQLDGSRLGWWGWSYGGYMTLYAMTHSDRIKAGVSVAPVTDWINYDSIYTERYGGLLPEMAEAYKRSSPVYSAAKLHGHVLEVHGTSDDNVHMQNTMQMIYGFQAASVPYDLQIYPRKTHGITGPATRTHLFNRIRNHFRHELLGTAAQP